MKGKVPGTREDVKKARARDRAFSPTEEQIVREAQNLGLEYPKRNSCFDPASKVFRQKSLNVVMWIIIYPTYGN